MILTLWQLLASFAQIGLFSLGGGAMLKLIEDECVHQRGWLSLEEFSTLVGTSFVFPGVIVVKVAGLVGLKVAGIPGMLVSVVGVAAPGLILLLMFYSMLMANRDHPTIKKLLVLMQYGSVAMLASALFSLAKPLERDFNLMAFTLAMALFIGVAVLEWSPFFGLVGFIAVGLFLL